MHMADAPKMSFIPKQTNGPAPTRVLRRHRHFNLFGFIGTVVFLCGMILAVGAYLYKDWSADALGARQAELSDIKDTFSQEDIDALRELSSRMALARSLLDAHLSPSLVFDALESQTQRAVQFTDFSYMRGESGSVEIALEGTAIRFNTLALQSAALSNADVLARAIFSGITVDDEGAVRFSVLGEGNPDALSYTAPELVPAAAAPAATSTPEDPSESAPQPVAAPTGATTGEGI